MPFIGKQSTSSANSKISKFAFTVGSGGEDAFTVASDAGDELQVFLNGVLLKSTTDYTYTTSTVTLASSAVENDILEVHVYQSFSLSDAFIAPSQTGHSGKYLGTDGTDTSWSSVDALPSQTGHNGKYLTTDGSDSSWDTLNPNSVTGSFQVTDETIVKIQDGISMMQTTLTGTHEVPSGYSAVVAGPIVVDTSATLTVNGTLVVL